MTERDLRRWSVEIALQRSPHALMKDLLIEARELENYIKGKSSKAKTQ